MGRGHLQQRQGLSRGRLGVQAGAARSTHPSPGVQGTYPSRVPFVSSTFTFPLPQTLTPYLSPPSPNYTWPSPRRGGARRARRGRARKAGEDAVPGLPVGSRRAGGGAAAALGRHPSAFPSGSALSAVPANPTCWASPGRPGPLAPRCGRWACEGLRSSLPPLGSLGFGKSLE